MVAHRHHVTAISEPTRDKRDRMKQCLQLVPMIHGPKFCKRRLKELASSLTVVSVNSLHHVLEGGFFAVEPNMDISVGVISGSVLKSAKLSVREESRPFCHDDAP